MHPILLSLLLGLTAAAANVFGGAIIVQKHWERAYLKYFVALGAGFMLATAIVEIVPTSFELRGRSAAFLILLGYLIIHFFEHTVTPHFHFGEETHHDQFVRGHHGYSVLLALIIHTFFDGIAIASGVISRRDHLRRCLRSYAGGEPGAGSTDGVGGLSRSGVTVPAGSVCTRTLNSTQHSPLGIQNVNG